MPGQRLLAEFCVNRDALNWSIDSRKSNQLQAEEGARWGRQFHCPPSHLEGTKTGTKDWGQASDATENKLQIHINLERKTNDKQKNIFAERPKSQAMGTKGAASALQTLGPVVSWKCM